MIRVRANDAFPFLLILFCNFHASFIACNNADQGGAAGVRKAAQVSEEKHQPYPAVPPGRSSRDLPWQEDKAKGDFSTASQEHSTKHSAGSPDGRSVKLETPCRKPAPIKSRASKKTTAVAAVTSAIRSDALRWVSAHLPPSFLTPRSWGLRGRARCSTSAANRRLEAVQSHFPHWFTPQMFNRYLFKLVDRSRIYLF